MNAGVSSNSFLLGRAETRLSTRLSRPSPEHYPHQSSFAPAHASRCHHNGLNGHLSAQKATTQPPLSACSLSEVFPCSKKKITTRLSYGHHSQITQSCKQGAVRGIWALFPPIFILKFHMKWRLWERSRWEVRKTCQSKTQRRSSWWPPPPPNPATSCCQPSQQHTAAQKPLLAFPSCCLTATSPVISTHMKKCGKNRADAVYLRC